MRSQAKLGNELKLPSQPPVRGWGWGFGGRGRGRRPLAPSPKACSYNLSYLNSRRFTGAMIFLSSITGQARLFKVK